MNTKSLLLRTLLAAIILLTAGTAYAATSPKDRIVNTAFFAPLAAVVPGPASVTTNEDTPVNITLTAEGGLGSPTFTIDTDPVNGDLTGTPPSLTYTPDPDFFGIDSFTFTACDPDPDDCAQQIVEITVDPVNDAPSFTAGADQVVNEDDGAQKVVNWATNISPGPINEGDQTLTFVITENTNSALFFEQPAIDSDGTLTYTPAANANGVAEISVILTDNGGTANGGDDASDPQSFTITINPLNDAPVLNGSPSFSLAAILEDAGAGGGNPGTSVSELIASAGSNPITDVDSGALVGIAVISVVNDNGDWQYSTNGGTSWSGFGSPSEGSARLLTTEANNRVRFVPDPDYNGSASITLRAWDRTTGTNGGIADTTTNGGTSAFSAATALASITITEVNDAPSFTAGTDQTVNEDAGAQTVTGWATNILPGPENENNQVLSFKVTNDNNGLFSVQPAVSPNGTLTYTPAPNANGIANVTVVLTDDGGTDNNGDDSSDPVTFTITVNAVPDPPVAVDDNYSTLEDTILSVNTPGVLGNDTDGDGDPLKASVITTTKNGSLNLNDNGSFTYTPKPNFNGTDSFTYQVSDGSNFDTATVTINVLKVNDAPFALADSYFTRVGETLTTNVSNGVLTNDTDIDLVTNPGEETLTAVLDQEPDPNYTASFTLNPDGSFTFTPKPKVGDVVVTFYYHVEDEAGAKSSSVGVSITILDLSSPIVNWISPVEDNKQQDIKFTGEEQIIRLEVNAVDDVEIDYVEFQKWDYQREYYDRYYDYSEPFTLDISTKFLLPQWNQIFVVAYDNVGHRSNRPSIWLKYLVHNQYFPIMTKSE